MKKFATLAAVLCLAAWNVGCTPEAEAPPAADPGEVAPVGTPGDPAEAPPATDAPAETPAETPEAGSTTN